jgi:hypothetical protein
MGNEIKGFTEKRKPGGVPFKKGNRPHNKKNDNGDRNSMPKTKILDDSRLEVSTRGEDLEPEDIEEELVQGETLIDEIEFKDLKGNNLKLRFLKKSTRLYRMQVILNDTVEIKPVTYSGSSMGNNYWNLIKGLIGK